MPVTIQGESDETIDRIAHSFAKYAHHYPQAQIEVRRQNSVTIYIRVINEAFAAVNRGDLARNPLAIPRMVIRGRPKSD